MKQHYETDGTQAHARSHRSQSSRSIAIATLVVSCLALAVSLATLGVVLTNSNQSTGVETTIDETAESETNEQSEQDEQIVSDVSEEDTQDEEQEESPAESIVLSDATLEADVTSSIDNGSWHVEVAEVTVTGNLLNVELAVTNNTDEASYNYSSIRLDVYQDGLELDRSYLGEDNPTGKVQPGTTFSINYAYELNNLESDVTVELSYPISDVVATSTWSLA